MADEHSNSTPGASKAEPLSYARPIRKPPGPPLEPTCRRALLCGALFFLTPLPAFAAIVYGILGIERTRDQSRPGRRAAAAGIFLGGAGIIAWVLGIFAVIGMRNHMLQIRTCSQLRELGSSLQIYASTHKGEYPDEWADLIAAGIIKPEMLISPAGDDTPACGATTQAVVADLKKPGHCSYLYFGKGLRHPQKSWDVVIACDLDSFRQTGEMVALYADGHVGVLPRVTAIQVLQEHLSAAATKPVTQPTTQP